MTGPPTWTRRGVLTALLAAGAGCSTDSDDSTTSSPEPSGPETPTDDRSKHSTTAAPTPTETATTTSESTTKKLTDVAFRETPQRTLRLDLYLPSTEKSSPFVVFAHGGGWIGGDKGHRPMFDRLVEKGFGVADIQYRLAQEKQYPAAVRDVVATVEVLTGDGAGHGMIDNDEWRDETLPTQEQFLAKHLGAE